MSAGSPIGLGSDGSQQHLISVILQEMLLAFRKRTDVDDPVRGNAHLLQRGLVGHGRNNEFSRVFKTDEALVQQVVN